MWILVKTRSTNTKQIELHNSYMCEYQFKRSHTRSDHCYLVKENFKCLLCNIILLSFCEVVFFIIDHLPYTTNIFLHTAATYHHGKLLSTSGDFPLISQKLYNLQLFAVNIRKICLQHFCSFAAKTSSQKWLRNHKLMLYVLTFNGAPVYMTSFYIVFL